MIILAAWFLHYSPLGPAHLLTAGPFILLGWIGGPLFFAFLFWYSRRKRSELDYLLRVREQLAGR